MGSISGNLDITAGGVMGTMVNTILKNFIPETAEQLTEAIGAKIVEIKNA